MTAPFAELRNACQTPEGTTEAPDSVKNGRQRVFRTCPTFVSNEATFDVDLKRRLGTKPFYENRIVKRIHDFSRSVSSKAMTKHYNLRDRERDNSEMNGDGAGNLQALGVADSGTRGHGSGTADTASEQQLALLQLQLKIAEAEMEKQRLMLESQRLRARNGAESNKSDDGVALGGRERDNSEMNGDGAGNLQALGVADSGTRGHGSGTADTASEQQLALLQLQLKIAEAEMEKQRLMLESQRLRARNGAESNKSDDGA
ncbi:hypothetical protein HPB51_022528 [Rhipicephalus microplus]|uniref:Uncharacterized protein n=1 Tax=Rhipicephalus microplus TaxID=6941 RepID=A0A9J6ECA9_RHIMP|nr:hypothetical protein HPB51_022528 [Rhipicephalus microplus]